MKKIFLFILAVGLFSCDHRVVNPENNQPDLRELTGSERAVVSSSNQFAFQLWNQITTGDPGSNLILSPLSVSYALGMTLNGAVGNTRSSMVNTLGFNDLSADSINSSFKSLTSFLLSLDKLTQINIANGVWYRNEYHVKQTFTNLVEKYFNGKTAGLDFSNPDAKNSINNWVSDQTKGKITNLVDRIPAVAVMYLVNAIYFKADWTTQFDKSLTHKGDFHLDNSATISTDLMDCKKAHVLYYTDNDITLVDIPYGNKQFALSVIMPSGNKTLADVRNLLSDDQYRKWLQESDSVTRELILPKFSISYDLLLNQALTDLGMGIAFSDTADFSNLFEETVPLQISRVIHKARIDVDETGSEAAAATGVEIGLTMAGPDQRILIDRPFYFIIHERYSNTILFCGQLMNPQDQ